MAAIPLVSSMLLASAATVRATGPARTTASPKAAAPAQAGKPAALDPAPAERHGSVTLEPGYYPPADPESSSVRVGRRLNAPLVRRRFHGGARSLDELGRRVCHALDYDRSDSLLALCVQRDEFRDVMWREFPQSRPATGIDWKDAWMILWGRLHGGSVSATREYGGHRYEFLRFERYDSTVTYRNFRLHNGLVLYARDEDGQVQRFTWLRSAVERRGSFKIYSMKD
jgi:hypothetical protein